MSEVWKQLSGATQQTNGIDTDNHKPSAVNGVMGHAPSGGLLGSLAGLYGLDPAAACSMMPGELCGALSFFLRSQYQDIYTYRVSAPTITTGL